MFKEEKEAGWGIRPVGERGAAVSDPYLKELIKSKY